MEITTVGIDLAKSIFQVHAIDAAGQVVVRKALRRAQVVPFFAKLPRCLVGMEACGTSHHWARELIRLGHDVRLMPPAYVKPYVKRGKTDANDAAALCEAVTRPSMRFVPVKSTEQKAALALHRTRDLLVKQRTQLVNMIRGLLAEFGIEMARGLRHALELAARLSAGDAAEVPPLAQRVVTGLADQIGAVQFHLTRLEKELLAWHRDSDLSQRLATIPGVGIVSATALAASVSEPERFRSGRQFAASLGLTLLQNCSGGKERLGRISRMGDRYLRRLLVVGMTSRALTRLDQRELSEASGVPLPTLKAFETVGSVDGKPSRRVTTMNNRALVEAFEKAGLEFIPENGGGAGIRFRDRKEPVG